MKLVFRYYIFSKVRRKKRKSACYSWRERELFTESLEHRSAEYNCEDM